MPSQPWSASFLQNSSVTAAGSAIRARTKRLSHSLSRNLRAVSRSNSCSSVNPISIAYPLGKPSTRSPIRCAGSRWCRRRSCIGGRRARGGASARGRAPPRSRRRPSRRGRAGSTRNRRCAGPTPTRTASGSSLPALGLAAQAPRQPAQSRHLQCLDVDRELGQLLADVALVPGGLLAVRELLR